MLQTSYSEDADLTTQSVFDKKWDNPDFAVLDNNDDNVDDFGRKDKICVNYIKKFLSGATDTKDECEVSVKGKAS